MWIPLHAHSHFSLLDGLSKPEQMAAHAVKCGFPGIALTDHGTIAGVPPFIKAVSSVCKCGHQKKQHDKKGCYYCKCECYDKYECKPIAGCEMYISEQNAGIKNPQNSNSHLCVLAKGREGWHSLMGATSAANRPDYFYRKPRLSLEQLASFSNNELIVFSGHLGSALANVCFEEPKLAYRAKDMSQVRSLVHSQWKTRVCGKMDEYIQLFGKENFKAEIQLIDHKNLPAAWGVAQMIRKAAKDMGVPCMATADSHYCSKQQAADHRVWLCLSMETTLKEVKYKMDNNKEVALEAFFRSNNYHIPDLQEISALHTAEELASTMEIYEMCEEFGIGASPLLPEFCCPNGVHPNEYLEHLCNQGLESKGLREKDVYRERLAMELDVLKRANLASYFLIVWDFVNYAREELNSLIGEGRGSAAGCLVSYLMNITTVDPLEFGLIFERFYNEGRNTPERIALPDIDIDLPSNKRDLVKDYLRRKYGAEFVCDMSTYGRAQGRGAMKDVLRVHSRCSPDEANEITEFIPDESEIADQLQIMEEGGVEPSIIRWALLHNKEQLKKWCFLDDEGSMHGPLSLDFAQAMRLEGTKRNRGKHASGYIISSAKLSDVAPIIFDRTTGEQVVDVDMRDGEDMGLVKFDLLATSVLDKLNDAQEIVNYGEIREDD